MSVMTGGLSSCNSCLQVAPQPTAEASVPAAPVVYAPHEDLWFFIENDKPSLSLGPLSKAELAKLSKKGKLGQQTFVYHASQPRAKGQLLPKVEKQWKGRF